MSELFYKQRYRYEEIVANCAMWVNYDRIIIVWNLSYQHVFSPEEETLRGGWAIPQDMACTAG